jgi:hypothetical protein
MSSGLSGMLSLLRISPASRFEHAEDILTMSHGCGPYGIHKKSPDSLIAVVEPERIDALGHCTRYVSLPGKLFAAQLDDLLEELDAAN